MTGWRMWNHMGRGRGLVLLLLFVAGAVWATVRAQSGSTDLRGFHEAWSTVWEAVFQRAELEDVERYPPGFLVLFAPLGALPRWAVGLGWYVLNIGCSVAVWLFTCRMLSADPRDGRVLLPALIGTVPFWLDNLVLGQNAPLLMALVAGAWWLTERRRPIAAGLCIGLGTVVKLIPAIFLLPMMLHRNWRVLGGFVAGVAALSLGLGTLFLGGARNWQMHVDWFQEITSTESSAAEDPTRPATMRYSLRYNNQSLEAVTARLLLPINAGTADDPFRVNLVEVSATTWRTLRAIAIALILLAGGVGLFDVLYSPGAIAWPAARSLSIVTLMMLLLCPLVWTHYFVWGFFPLAYVARGRPDGSRGARGVLAVWILAMLAAPFPVMRGIGVNIGATLALFGLLTAPHLGRVLTGLTRLARQRGLPAKAPGNP